MSKSLKLYGLTGVSAIAVLTAAYNFADRTIAPMPSDAPILAADSGSPDMMFIASARAEAAADAKRMGLGREALAEEVAAWDLDVAPDGTGLPVGSGSVAEGEEVFIAQCAVCHGEFAEGRGNWPKLAGGDGTLADKDPLKTVGSYWPYLSTVWDYVHRSMPYGAAQTLTADETYAITAYILYSNYLVEDDFVLSHENFLEVEMPNADGFFVDDREEADAHFWNPDACMSNCKDSVEITMRASILDVTPEDEEEAAAEPAATEEVEMAAAEAEEAAAEPAAEETAALNPELVAAGEKLFRQCQACHQVGDGAKNRVGPQLNGVMGRTIGGVEDFRYSKTMAAMGEEGQVWDEESMAAFLADPRGYVKGTKMSYRGLKKDEDIAAMTEYLKSFSN